MPAGSLNLRVASDAHAVFCPSGTPDGGLTLSCTADGGTRCERGVYTRVFDGDCAPEARRDIFTGTVPFWVRFNYTSNVPIGTSIRFGLRASNTIGELAAARSVSLPDAPVGAPASPTSLDLHAILCAASTPSDVLIWKRYLQITAYMSPSADGAIAPTLVSTEIQYVCLDTHHARCR